MNTIVRYSCSICHTEYQRPEFAIGCEQRHIMPVEKMIQYGSNQLYPDRIMLKMADGTILIYRKSY